MSKLLSAAAVLLTLGASPANAALITLFASDINVDGNTAAPAGVDISGFDAVTGLGTIAITVSGAGLHNVLAYFDYEFDEGPPENPFANTFFNERADTGGVLAAGQSFEVDEPGFAEIPGDVFDHFENSLLASLLSNTNDLAGIQEDVAAALGFGFALDATQTAVVSFFVSAVNSSAGFFVRHFDPDSIADQSPGPNELFMWSTLTITITGGETQPPIGVPEPGTLALLAVGLLPLLRRRLLHA